MRSWNRVLQLLFTAAGVVGVAGAAWTMVGAQDQAKSTKPAAAAGDARSGPAQPYGDKVISIYTKGGMSPMGHSLQEVTLTTKYGRQFLVGKGVDDGSWTRGLQIEIAWDEVASVIVFDSLEEYNERIRESGEDNGGMGILGGNIVLPDLP